MSIFVSNVTSNRFCFSFAICIWININIQSNEGKNFIWLNIVVYSYANGKGETESVTSHVWKKNGQSTFWMLPPHIGLSTILRKMNCLILLICFYQISFFTKGECIIAYLNALSLSELSLELHINWLIWFSIRKTLRIVSKLLKTH